LEALQDTPVVFLRGARQTGKTTLVRSLAEEEFEAHYVTLDNLTTHEAASSDPEGYIRSLETPVIIDEAQRVPEVFRVIKAEVDRERRPGRYLLTGSSNPDVVGEMSQSLVGRVEILTLRPFSVGELRGQREASIDAVFRDTLPGLAREGNGESLVELVAKGGYPEVHKRERPRRRDAWFDSYLQTLIRRDIRETSNIERLGELPRLLGMTASRCGGLLNYANISRDSGIPQTTVKRYLKLLEATFLLLLVPPWTANIGKRFVKSPKVMLGDTGLGTHVLGLGVEQLRDDQGRFGSLLENFVHQELVKQKGWNEVRVRIHHYRTHSQQEIDFVLERRDGRLAAIEVKSRGSVKGSDFDAMRSLRDDLEERFHRGIVLYTGDQVVPFGDDLHAVPVRALWDWGPRVGR